MRLSSPSPASLPQSDILQRLPKKCLKITINSHISVCGRGSWEGGAGGGNYFRCYCLHPYSGCPVSGILAWDLCFLAPGASGLAGSCGTFLTFWKVTLPQVYNQSGPWDRAGVGQTEGAQPLGLVFLPPGPGWCSSRSSCAPSSPPLSPPLRTCWDISPPPASDLGLVFSPREDGNSRCPESQALTCGPLVMWDSDYGSLSDTIQPKGLLTISAFPHPRGLFSPGQTQTRKK